jgi:hypothetical protein
MNLHYKIILYVISFLIKYLVFLKKSLTFRFFKNFFSKTTLKPIQKSFFLFKWNFFSKKRLE